MQDHQKAIIFLEEGLQQQRKIPDYHKTFLISKYYLLMDFDKIIGNKEICFEVGTSEILRYLFFASVFSEKYEIALSSAEKIEMENELSTELKSTFFALLAKTYFQLDRDEEIASTLLKVSDLKTVRAVFNDMVVVNSDKDRIEKILEGLSNMYVDENKSNFIQGVTFAALKESGRAENSLDKLDVEFLKENDLVGIVAVSYLSNENNISINKAIQLLEQRPNKEPSSNEIIGLYYYEAKRDSLALKYLTKEIAENTNTNRATFIVASMVAEVLNNFGEMIRILEKGVEIYPDNTDILNSLGYSYAKYDIITKYDLAEKYLKKALQTEKENAMIWDSIAWLYFKKGQYKKALESMKIPLEDDIEHSEIAYHLGEIYLKLKKSDISRKYFELAVQLANNDQAVEHSKKILLDQFGIAQNSNEEE